MAPEEKAEEEAKRERVGIQCSAGKFYRQPLPLSIRNNLCRETANLVASPSRPSSGNYEKLRAMSDDIKPSDIRTILGKSLTRAGFGGNLLDPFTRCFPKYATIVLEKPT
jgi:hypothetical protein